MANSSEGISANFHSLFFSEYIFSLFAIFSFPVFTSSFDQYLKPRPTRYNQNDHSQLSTLYMQMEFAIDKENKIWLDLEN